VGTNADRYWGYGWLGGLFFESTFRVDFFFVLSGFALWTAHRADAGRPGGWRSFLWKRLWRLYPLLIILTLVKAFVLWLVPGRNMDSYHLLPSLLALPQNAFPMIVAAWTLSFEVGFTIVLTACLALPAGLSLPALVAWGASISCTGWFLGIRPGLHGVSFLTHPFILEFVFGVLAAEAVRLRLRHQDAVNRPWGIAFCALAFTGLMFGATHHSWLTSHPVILQKVFWAVVFAMGLSGLTLWERSVPAQAWRLRDSLGLGRASYSIFLGHGFVLMGAFALLRPSFLPAPGFWMDVLIVLLVILSVLFGQLVWHCLERPLSRLCRS
jgi:peptidoglycan/LPS O-acetylase OafA/YrhL